MRRTLETRLARRRSRDHLRHVGVTVSVSSAGEDRACSSPSSSRPSSLFRSRSCARCPVSRSAEKAAPGGAGTGVAPGLTTPSGFSIHRDWLETARQHDHVCGAYVIRSVAIRRSPFVERHRPFVLAPCPDRLSSPPLTAPATLTMIALSATVPSTRLPVCVSVIVNGRNIERPQSTLGCHRGCTAGA